MGLVLFFTLIFAATVFAVADSGASVLESAGGGYTPYYQSVSRVDFKLAFSGATADASVVVKPKSGAAIDSVKISTKLMKTGSSTAVKTWSQTLYPDATGKFTFYESHKVSSRGTYYINATVKCYQGTTLLETIQGESLQVTY